MILARRVVDNYPVGIFKNQREAAEVLMLSYTGIRRKQWDKEVKKYKGYLFTVISYGLFDLKIY